MQECVNKDIGPVEVFVFMNSVKMCREEQSDCNEQYAYGILELDAPLEAELLNSEIHS